MDTMNLKAKDLMKKDVKKTTKTTPLLSAARLMQDTGVSSLVIEPDDEADAFGIVTRKDVVEALVADGIAATSYLVEDVMSKPAITVASELSIYNCQQLMRMVGVRRLPVVRDTKVVGILSNSDIFSSLVEEIS